jgi:hypothetical protein
VLEERGDVVHAWEVNSIIFLCSEECYEIARVPFPKLLISSCS